jgi:hypothetical protein
MDVSGYARLFSEYHDKPELWQTVQALWDTYLGMAPQALKMLSAVTSLEQIQFTLPHRSMLRGTWESEVRQVLSKLHKRVAVEGRYSQVEVFTHPSPLVRLVANDEFIDGVEIFIGDFLARKLGAEDLKWGYKRPEQFQERLERERERDAKGRDEDATTDSE